MWLKWIFFVKIENGNEKENDRVVEMEMDNQFQFCKNFESESQC